MMKALDPSAAGRTSAQFHLARIADVLGEPVSVFFEEGGASSELRATAELIQLWAAVTDHAVRTQVLDMLRAEAARLPGHAD